MKDELIIKLIEAIVNNTKATYLLKREVSRLAELTEENIFKDT